MKYSDILIKVANENPGFFTRLKTWAGDKYMQGVDAVNDHVRTNFIEPQAAAATTAATDAAIDNVINRIGEYGLPVLAGAGIAGIATHSISEWLNEKRRNKGVHGETLPTRLLTTLAAIGGGIGGGYLYDKYVKTAAYGDLPTEVTPDMEVPEEEQEELTDPSGKKKKNKKKQLPENIQQMIYAQNAKKRREHMKEASLTYSNVAEIMGNTKGTLPTQGNGTFRLDPSTQNTKFTTPKTVPPVQPPKYRQIDTTVQDTEDNK